MTQANCMLHKDYSVSSGVLACLAVNFYRMHDLSLALRVLLLFVAQMEQAQGRLHGTR